MTEVAAEEAPGPSDGRVSGPSFALEVARGQPTAVWSRPPTDPSPSGVQRALSSRTFRAYSSDDVVASELAGALKNVIAIAAGIVDGLGYGSNTVAALVTRGLAEITRLAVRQGGRADTLAGLAGLGDLVLTCTGDLSRNRSVGQALGRGSTPRRRRRGDPHGRRGRAHDPGRLRSWPSGRASRCRSWQQMRATCSTRGRRPARPSTS